MSTGAPLRVDVACHERPDVLARSAADLEQHRAAGFFVSEAQHDPFVGLAAAAGRTERITLGTSVAIAFARTPMSLAYAAHDVHRLSEGRLVLGLGTQVAAHVTRRYGMPWSRPAARMREYVAAVREIWRTWETGDRLRFEGDFYTHTLMLPAFSPGPLDLPPPRIWLAAVGPLMTSVAADVADGLILHPLTSERYRDEVVVPQVDHERRSHGRDGPFDLSAMALVASGVTDEAFLSSVRLTRMQIAFYASTPAYLPVLEHHGWGDLHREAHATIARGGLDELPALVDDEVLGTFAVVGGPSEVAEKLVDRYAGHVDRVTITTPFQPVGAGSAAVAVLDAVTEMTGTARATG